jgi:hypothetical protein
LPIDNRYHELFSIYGQVEPLAEVNLSPPKFAKVKVTFNRAPADDDHVDKENSELVERKQIKVDLKQSVKEFKVTLRLVISQFVSKYQTDPPFCSFFSTVRCLMCTPVK